MYQVDYQIKKNGNDFGFEVFGINAVIAYGAMEFNLDQRFYPSTFGGAYLKYGWFQ